MKLVTLIRRRALAYELLDEYDAEHLPVDPAIRSRWLDGIRTHSSFAAGVAALPSSEDRLRAAIKATHGRSVRDGTRP